MTETAEFKRGAGGRPTRAEAERRLENLLATAARLFLERGYEAVSVEEIAKQAGVAKRFIYARYGNKADLFVATFERTFPRLFQSAMQTIKPSRHGVERGLYELGRKFLDIAIQPEAITLHRLFVSAAPLFPDIARRFVERNRELALTEVERVFKFYVDRGEIELPQPRLMIEQFLISVAGIPQRLALMGLSESPAEQDRRLRIAVRLFVRGCGKPKRGARDRDARRADRRADAYRFG